MPEVELHLLNAPPTLALEQSLRERWIAGGFRCERHSFDGGLANKRRCRCLDSLVSGICGRAGRESRADSDVSCLGPRTGHDSPARPLRDFERSAEASEPLWRSQMSRIMSGSRSSVCGTTVVVNVRYARDVPLRPVRRLASASRLGVSTGNIFLRRGPKTLPRQSPKHCHCPSHRDGREQEDSSMTKTHAARAAGTCKTLHAYARNENSLLWAGCRRNNTLVGPSDTAGLHMERRIFCPPPPVMWTCKGDGEVSVSAMCKARSSRSASGMGRLNLCLTLKEKIFVTFLAEVGGCSIAPYTAS